MGPSHGDCSRTQSVRDVQRFLPLRPAVFHILLALRDGERHGYALKQEVEGRTNRVVKLGPGTLYETIQRLLERGLIEETARRPPAERDQAQRRYYRITRFGRRVLETEVERLGEIVDYARSAISPDSGHPA